MKNRRSSKKKGGKKNIKKSPTQNLKQNHGAVAATSPPLTCDFNAAINNEHSCRHGGTKFDNVSTKICLKYLSYDGEWDWEDLSRAIVEANPAEDFVANLYGFAASQCQICELYTVDQQLASIGAARSGSKTVSPNCFTKFVKAAIFFEKGRPYNAGLTSQKHFLELMGDEVETEKYLRMNWCCTKHCGSMRDVVLYIDKKIPCDCLKDMKKKLLEEPEVRRCSNCGKGETKTMWCPNCECSEYCSKDCQLAHWSIHQFHCPIFQRKLSILDAAKESAQVWCKKRDT
ncbi:expressed unknown protein [Seminavis robusta]|uniref:MYND-type domain-containing protein n=1 Tax=Seminavis robusta TaxID=568900 RepID=A0A9N8EUF0_9STRA|nr:expressed unknown protein [Seminavis robusta]|eukprot:Sro1718_g293370.1 n/a (287) ;mRNA; r:22181-23041